MKAAELLALHKTYVAADQERMKRRPARMPRNEWRTANPIPVVVYPTPRDTKYKSKPRRTLGFIDHSPRLFVGTALRFCDVIDLTEPDADTRLDRYDFT
jgi:hypothetical protein